ncbi:uncharacterized protein KY384_002116 [Bacidia gigantensis]|uniref:uncharacterized protein n=1 Tax=Bacidia gigantensis TaxID=2732470 RepID=UPI001D038B1E|nr:uncharacterized protein KY384_002116 [Bacidia gigantensis]KAG8533333.1 hypothetical protein KY384_002116 [Bacidia gigantensis]
MAADIQQTPFIKQLAASANPLPQQRLSKSLASLLLALPTHVFIPFLSAFFQTIINYWSSIPALRLDKYLFLIRLYVLDSFVYLSRKGWDKDLVDAWRGMLVGEQAKGSNGECAGVMDPMDQKIGDGLRYHLLDVWVDGLVNSVDWAVGVERGIMGPIEGLAKEGQGRTVRERASDVLSDERLLGDAKVDGVDLMAVQEDDGEFGGFED